MMIPDMVSFWIFQAIIFTSGATQDIKNTTCYNKGTTRTCYHVSSKNASWINAFENCIDMSGQLVIYDEPSTHSNLKDIMLDYKLDELWIGARSEPMYWHWTHDLYGKPSTIKLTYQGCYSTQLFDPGSNSTFESKINLENCREFCTKGAYEYMGLQKPSKEEQSKWQCFCSNQLPKSGSNFCETLHEHGIQRKCGIKTSHTIAIYVTDSQTNYREWTDGFPFGLTGKEGDEYCLTAHWDEGGKRYLLKTHNCTNSAKSNTHATCYANESSVSCNSTQNKYVYKSGKLSLCLHNTWYGSWQKAEELCKSDHKGHMLPLFNKDLNKFNKDTYNKSSTNIWVGGTSLRWTWVLASGEKRDITSEHYWNGSAVFPYKGLCLSLKKYGDKKFMWKHSECNQKKIFVCQINNFEETNNSSRSTRKYLETTITSKILKESSSPFPTNKGLLSGKDLPWVIIGLTIGVLFIVIMIMLFAVKKLRRSPKKEKQNLQIETDQEMDLNYSNIKMSPSENGTIKTEQTKFNKADSESELRNDVYAVPDKKKKKLVGARQKGELKNDVYAIPEKKNQTEEYQNITNEMIKADTIEINELYVTTDNNEPKIMNDEIMIDCDVYQSEIIQ